MKEECDFGQPGTKRVTVGLKDNTGLRTKKAARQAGYIGEREVADLSGRMVPRHGAEPLVIKGENFFSPEDCERLLNKTDARNSGLRVPNGLEPVAWRSWQYGTFGLWRESELVPVMRQPPKPPVVIDLLAAVFAVNRSAKRYRDAASSCYSSRSHGLAKAAKQQKERLYQLKDCGIAEAHRLGRIQYVGRNGGLALYRGEGYSFHSRLLPPGQSEEHDDGDASVFMEAKPRGAKEARLKDAILTLELLSDPDGFTVLSLPMFVREMGFRTYDDEEACAGEEMEVNYERDS